MLKLDSFSTLEIFLLSFSYIFIRATIVILQFKLMGTKIPWLKKINLEVPSKEQVHHEWVASIKANSLEAFMLFLFLVTGAMKTTPLSWVSFWGTFIFCYIFFEIWFYFSHRFLHTKKFKKIHQTHHISVITTPMSAQTMDLREKLINDVGLYLVPALVSQFIPLSMEGFILYHFLNFYFNVLGHANLELVPQWFVNSKAGKLFTTATYHSIHHLKGHSNMGLFTTVCDRLFGTYDPSYLDIYAKVVSSKPLVRKEVVLMGKHPHEA